MKNLLAFNKFAKTLPAAAGKVLCRMQSQCTLLTGALALCVVAPFSYAETPGNTLITNTAFVDYQFAGNQLRSAGAVTFITARDGAAGTPSKITLMRQGTLATVNASVKSANNASTKASSLSGSYDITQGECAMGSTYNFVSQAQPTSFTGTTLTLPGTYSLKGDEYFKVGDAIFIHLQDLDQNLDPTMREDVLATVTSENGMDSEIVRLRETGISTGEFVGYIQSANLNSTPAAYYDCALSVRNDSPMTATYTDRYDSVDISASAATFDPSSFTFDAKSGARISGISVTLIDESTGLPATVLGDDGISTFPSTIVSGQSTTDSSGRVYSFANGGFRFPIVADGDYHIVAADTDFYRFPSSVSDDVLNTLPGAPFRLSDASRGETFSVASAFQMDVPMDPKDNSVILSKTVSRSTAAIGDFLQYSISLRNSEVPGDNVLIKDRLPRGMRYMQGTTLINGVKAADPDISSDGQQLTFHFANIAADARYEIRYVTRVGIDATVGEAINRAWLEDDKLSANNAKAAVEITEELFSNAARVFGRVYIADCEGNVSGEGIGDVRIYQENGTYVVTDKDGMWHMEGQLAGSHVIQLDTDSLPKYLDLVSCDNQAFHAGTPYSQFVDLQPGSFWRADFIVRLKPPANGEVVQRLSSHIVPMEKNEAEQFNAPVAQKLIYKLQLTGSDVALKDLRAVVLLPEGVSYKKGSALFDGQKIADPEGIDNSSVQFNLGHPGKDWQHELVFEGLVTQDAKAGELNTRAFTLFSSPSQADQRTPVAMTSALLYIMPPTDSAKRLEKAPKFDSFSAELSAEERAALDKVVEDLKGLKNLQLELIGHTDSVPIARRSRHIFTNNEALSLGRARVAANYLMEKLNLEPSQITVAGRGAQEPVSQKRDKNSRAQNRRVEVRMLGGTNNMEITLADSGNQMVATRGIAPGGYDFPVEATAAGAKVNYLAKPGYYDTINETWLAQQNNNFAIVWPAEDYQPSAPATQIAIKHSSASHVRLFMNGQEVSAVLRDSKMENSAAQVQLSQWRGVHIKEGDNRIRAELLDIRDNIIASEERNVHFASVPASVEYLADESNAIANGIDTPVIAVRLRDKDGYPIRRGVRGDLNISSPYSLYNDKKQETQISRQEIKPTYEVGDDGIAYISLEPTTQAGEAVIKFQLANNQSKEIRSWLKPQSRNWMLVAIGEGTIGYQKLQGHIENARSDGQQQDFYSEGRVALFTKGQIKGEWLITAAYDSAKGKTTPFEKLLDPNKYYTLYGDASNQKEDAPTSGKLYVRVEKERFYTIFGDYSLDMNETKLAAYSRKLFGVQSVYQGDVLSFNLFATESAQRYVRDEIQGDGTSGLYRLSSQNIITQSEKVILQVRDRYRSEIIVSEQELTRDTDYTIDYFDGTIFFKSAVQATDANLNPRYIIASYETQSSDQDHLTYGGRAAVHVLNNNVELGMTHIQEDMGTTERQLNGVDLRAQVSTELEIKAELAQTNTSISGSSSAADAQLVELNYVSENHQANAYVRRQESGFGLDQLNQSESGSEKAGIESRYYFDQHSQLHTLISDQKVLGSDGRQQMLESRYEHQYAYGDYHIGARVAEQTDPTGENTTGMQQILLGHGFDLLNSRLHLSADTEFNLRHDADQYDVARLSADYRFTQSISMFAVHETSWDKNAPIRSSIGLRTSPWQGAQTESSVEQFESRDGMRLFAVNGLKQNVNLNKHWQMSFGFDQSKDLENTLLEDADSTDQEDFYAFTTGLGYRSESWQWNNRAEYREAQTSHKWNGLSSLFHPVSEGLAMGLSAQYYLQDYDDGQLDKEAIMEFNLGYRPLNNGFAWLNQTRHILDENRDNNSAIISRRLVNNTHMNYRWNSSQISGQYGLKKVLDDIDENRFEGLVDLIGTEYRYHFNPRWDMGLHARRLHSYEENESLHSAGFSVGYIPQRNTWLSVGYNHFGFVDTDFSDASYTAQGIYLKLRIKADQDSLAQLKAYFE